MKNILRFIIKNKTVLIDAAILFGLMILFFSRWIFIDHYSLFASDIIQDFVTHRFAAFSWSHGLVPLWDPYFFWASVGYLNSGFFYPFNLLLDLLHIFTYPDLNESYLLMQANIFFHFFLASFFMYLLVRRFVSSRTIAIMSGVIFAYSGYMVKSYLHYNYILSAPWLPLFFLFLYKSIFERKNWLRDAILAGIVFAVSLLPGQTQPAIYFFFLMLAFASYSAYHFWQTKEKRWAKPFLSFLVVVVVTFGLFALQFFPAYEYKKYTPRESIEYSYSIGYSVDPLYFVIHSFIPSFWGTMQSSSWDGMNMETLPSNDQPKWLDRFFGGLPNEMTFYLGLLPFFILPFAALAKNKFLRNFLFILLFFSILLMLARNMPLVGRLYWMVLGGVARVPARAAILWSFSLSFLTALGLQAILDLRETKKELFEKIAKVNFLILISLVFIFFPLLLSLLLSQAGKPAMVFFFFPMLNSYSLFLVYFLIYSVLIFAFIKLKEQRLLLFLIALFTVVDIFSFHTGNTYLLGSTPERTLGVSAYPEIGSLQADKEYFRVQGLKMGAYANNLYSLGYGTTGSSGFAYRPLTEVYNAIPDEASSIYSLLNVKYFYALDGRLGDWRSSVSSSSYLGQDRPQNAFDGDPKTEWVINSEKEVNNTAWLNARFRQLSEVAEVKFLGGNQGGTTKLSVLTSDGKSQDLVLSSTKEGWNFARIKPVKTTGIKLIMSDLSGSSDKGGLLSFSEIAFFDQAGKQIELGFPGIEKVTDRLFLNKNYFPRAFATYQYKVFNDKSELLSAMSADPSGEAMRRTVFLSQQPLGFKNPDTVPTEESLVKIKNYDLQKVTIEADMKAEGFVVLSDVWYPGWKAFVDGKQVPLYKAYHVLRAVLVSQGKHEVVFSYQSNSFKRGAFISLITVGIIFLYFFYLLAFGILFKRKK